MATSNLDSRAQPFIRAGSHRRLPGLSAPCSIPAFSSPCGPPGTSLVQPDGGWLPPAEGLPDDRCSRVICGAMMVGSSEYSSDEVMSPASSNSRAWIALAVSRRSSTWTDIVRDEMCISPTRTCPGDACTHGVSGEQGQPWHTSTPAAGVGMRAPWRRGRRRPVGRRRVRTRQCTTYARRPDRP